MTPTALFLLTIAAVWFAAALRHDIRDRAAATVDRHRHTLHDMRVRYGRPGMGRKR